MLPISPRAERAISGSAGSTPRSVHTVAALGGSKSRTTVALRSPITPSTTAVTSSSGEPTASTASASVSASARGTVRSTVRPSMLESAVAAVPEPILEISRSPSSCMSVSSISRSSCRVCKFGSRSRPAGRRRRLSASASQSTIRLIVPSESTAPPDRQLCDPASAGKRSRHQLALADELLDHQRQPPLGAAGDDDEGCVGRRLVPERLGQVDQRQDAVGRAPACASR